MHEKKQFIFSINRAQINYTKAKLNKTEVEIFVIAICFTSSPGVKHVILPNMSSDNCIFNVCFETGK